MLLDDDERARLSIPARVLLRAISELSEEQYAASWMHDIEHTIWEADRGWRDVAAKLGCWVHYTIADGAEQLTIPDWQELHARWLAKHPGQAVWVQANSERLAP